MEPRLSMGENFSLQKQELKKRRLFSQNGQKPIVSDILRAWQCMRQRCQAVIQAQCGHSRW